MKHTPGPWKRDSYYSPELWKHNLIGKESFSPYIVDGNGRNVAAAMMIPLNESEFVANARLIAAAPDMLKALERVELIFHRDGLQALRGLAWHDGDLQAIQDAISSARGEIRYWESVEVCKGCGYVGKLASDETCVQCVEWVLKAFPDFDETTV